MRISENFCLVNTAVPMMHQEPIQTCSQSVVAQYGGCFAIALQHHDRVTEAAQTNLPLPCRGLTIALWVWCCEDDWPVSPAPPAYTDIGVAST